MSSDKVAVSVAALDAVSDWYYSMRRLNLQCAEHLELTEGLIRKDERSKALLELLDPFMPEISRYMREISSPQTVSS